MTEIKQQQFNQQRYEAVIAIIANFNLTQVIYMKLKTTQSIGSILYNKRLVADMKASDYYILQKQAPAGQGNSDSSLFFISTFGNEVESISEEVQVFSRAAALEHATNEELTDRGYSFVCLSEHPDIVQMFDAPDDS